jgi:cytochrome c-type biogenesis protein CcmH/NrfF
MTRPFWRSRWLLACLAALCWLTLSAPVSAAEATAVAADPALEMRVNALASELRCLVCQNQSLADSHADLAIDLKNQVREQLKAGRSDAQVIDYMTERYGDFVRYRPPLKATTVLLWGGPLLLLLAGGVALWRNLGARARRPEPNPLEPEAAARLAEMLEQKTS